MELQVSGKITDTAGVGLSRATIRLIIEQDTINKLTQEDGTYNLKSPTVKKIKLWVTMKGYLSYLHSYSIPENSHSFSVPTITLGADYSELDPVTISRVRPITYQGDTVSYHVAAFPVRDGAEVEDILKRLPGIEVDMNGSVIIQGKPVKKLLVNGKEFFGGDVLLAIRNLPADIVDKIQVIDDYGDKARLTGIRSGEASKVLNVVLKQDKRNGQFGNLQGGGGNEGKYLADAFGNAFRGDQQISVRGGISNNSPVGQNYTHSDGFNYADQLTRRLAASLNFTNSGSNARSSVNSIQDNFYSGEQQHQTQNNQTSAGSNINNLKTILTYKPDNYSTLRFNTSATLRQFSTQTASSFTNLQQDSNYNKSTTGQALNKNNAAGNTISINTYYEKIFPQSRRRFNVTAVFNYSDNLQKSDNQSTATVLTDGISSNSLLHYLVNNNSKNWSANFSSTYFMPFGASSFLELGYNGQTSQSQQDLLTQTPTGQNGSLVMVDSLSQNQLFYTLTQNLHAGYSAHISKLDLSASLDAQPGLQRGSVDAKSGIASYHYFSLLPHMEVAWILNKTQLINLNYSGERGLPSLQQLTPYTNVTNPQYPIVGNPALNPSSTNSASLHYEFSSLQSTQFQGLGAGLSYSSTKNSIISNITHPKDSSQVIQSTSYVNAGNLNTFTADYHLTFPSFFNKRLRVTANGNINHTQAPTMTDGLLYNTETWAWNQSLHLQLIIPDLIESELEASYSINHTTYPASATPPNVFKSASITWGTRQYILKHWIVNYRLSQPYTSSGRGLQTAPADLTAAIQREFLRHNKATITLTGYNLLNSTAGVGQSSSATGITQTRTQFIGRYFFCTIIFKLNHFNN
jgi:hypothetical protein